MQNQPTVELSDKSETIESKLERLMHESRPKEAGWIPDWRNESHYQVLKDASLKQWAWEFLRRNRFYQQEIDQSVWIDNWGDDCWNGFYQRWGIGYPKPYCAEYKSSAKGAMGAHPRWEVIQPRRVIDHRGEMGQFIAGKKEIMVEEGQVAIVFDLRTAWLNPKILAAQIDSIKPRLQRALGTHCDVVAPDTAPRPQFAKLTTYLRVADAIGGREKTARKEIGRQFAKEGLLFTKQRDGNYLDELGDIDFGKSVEHPMKAAYGLIYNFGYLDLLVTNSKNS